MERYDLAPIRVEKKVSLWPSILRIIAWIGMMILITHIESQFQFLLMFAAGIVMLGFVYLLANAIVTNCLFQRRTEKPRNDIYIEFYPEFLIMEYYRPILGSKNQKIYCKIYYDEIKSTLIHKRFFRITVDYRKYSKSIINSWHKNDFVHERKFYTYEPGLKEAMCGKYKNLLKSIIV